MPIAFPFFLSLLALAGAPESRFAKLDEHRVHYQTLGDGPLAVVLIHGWTCSLETWRGQVPALEGKVRTVLIDLPGHGKSDKPGIDYTMDLFARAVVAVLDDAKVERAVLVGHSMGTPVARQVWRLAPKRVLGIVAMDGSLRRFQMKPEDEKKFIGQFEGPGFAEAVVRFIDGMFPPGSDRKLRDEVLAIVRGTPQHVAVSAMKGMLAPSIWKEDPIEVPVLALMAKSPSWNDVYWAQAKKTAPRLESRTFEGVGHFLMMEKPEPVNEALLAFLKDQGLVK
jgi:pimeloyl-ACP methyl ester carboxylesterase